MWIDILFYLCVFVVSFVIGTTYLSKMESKHLYDNRHLHETTEQSDRESNDSRRLDFDDLAVRVRDTCDPVVEEILEQTAHIRAKRRSMPHNREENEMRRDSESSAGIKTTTGSITRC